MQNLIADAIAVYKEAMKAPTKAALELRQVFEGLTTEEKLTTIIRDKFERPNYSKSIFDVVLGSDSSYNGTGNASLYDDFYWERCETKYLSDILDMTMEDVDTGEVETPEGLAKIILADDGPRVVTLVDMLEKNLGECEHDW